MLAPFQPSIEMSWICMGCRQRFRQPCLSTITVTHTTQLPSGWFHLHPLRTSIISIVQPRSLTLGLSSELLGLVTSLNFLVTLRLNVVVDGLDTGPRHSGRRPFTLSRTVSNHPRRLFVGSRAFCRQSCRKTVVGQLGPDGVMAEIRLAASELADGSFRACHTGCGSGRPTYLCGFTSRVA